MDGFYQPQDRDLPTKLRRFFSVDNTAEEVDDQELVRIGQRVVEGFTHDLGSRGELDKAYDEALKMALQVKESKTYPWPGASNVKYPLLTTSVLQFQARAMPTLLGAREITKARVFGKDPDGEKLARGRRVSKHMSWQLTDQEEGWEDDTDKMLGSLCIFGTMFRKVYFDPEKGHNDSIVLSPKDVIVNNAAENLQRAARITQILRLYPHEITERIRFGRYLDIDIDDETDIDDEDGGLVEFLEQHVLIDMDGDGYPEPYIVTVHKETAKVVRIIPRYTAESIHYNSKNQIARIDPVQYFVKYTFLPSPDGTFYGLGFGTLLGPINAAVNATLNQLIDAGTLANTPAGLISENVRIPTGSTGFRPGQFIRVKTMGPLAGSFVPLQFPGPSSVLLQLLGMLIDAGKQITTVSDIMVGESKKGETATTTLSRTEQGMKMFSSIIKRLHRAFREEYQLRYKLNSLYIDPEEYTTVLDDEMANANHDYAMGDYDISPASDPNMTSQTHATMQAEALMPFANDPTFDGAEIKKRYIEALGVTDVDALLAKGPASPPPEMVFKAAELENARLELEIKKTLAESGTDKIKAEIKKLMADAIKSIAQAESLEKGTQINAYKAAMDGIVKMNSNDEGGEENERGGNDPGRLERVSDGPQDQGVLPGAEPDEDGNAGHVGDGRGMDRGKQGEGYGFGGNPGNSPF